MIMCVSVIGLGLSLSKLQWIESAPPSHESSVSGSNDPLSADLHDDTSVSLQPVLRPTMGNLASGAFLGVGE